MERPEATPDHIETEHSRTAATNGARFEYLVELLHKAGVERTSISDWPVETEPGKICWQHAADKGKEQGFTQYSIDRKGLIRGAAARTKANLANTPQRRIGRVETTGLIGNLESMARKEYGPERDRFLAAFEQLDALADEHKRIWTSTGKVLMLIDGEVIVETTDFSAGPCQRFGVGEFGQLTVAKGSSAIEAGVNQMEDATASEHSFFFDGVDVIVERARQTELFN